MPAEQPKPNAPSHRSSKLRYLQLPLQVLALPAMKGMHRLGLLEGTPAAQALALGEMLHANHVTDSGLKLITEGSNELITTGNFSGFIKVISGFSTDMFDGPLAKHQKEVSPEGAIRDVLVDRAADIRMGDLITEVLGPYQGGDTSVKKGRLLRDFSISMLTKAGSEMFGVRSRESAGMGSMLHRRIVLLFDLIRLGNLSRGIPSESQIRKTVSQVNANLDSLIEGSEEKAKARIDKILLSPTFENRWDNQALNDPNSAAATEAGKYAAVVTMNQRVGLDPVGYLNSVAKSEVFPSAEYLMANYEYIRERVNNMQPFLDFALSLINPNQTNVTP